MNPYWSQCEKDFSKIPKSFSWLTRLREKGFSQVAQKGFPTTNEEDWHYTPLGTILNRSYQNQVESTSPLPSSLNSFLASLGLGPKMVFINGRFSAAHSSPGSLGAWGGSIASLLADSPQLIESSWNSELKSPPIFAALNFAFFQDGLFLSLPDHRQLQEPLHLVYVNTGVSKSFAIHPRNLILVGEGSRLSLVEHYWGADATDCLTNVVTEIRLGQNSEIDFYKIQQEGPNASHLGYLTVHQERGSRFRSHVISWGASLFRNEIRIDLAGEGSECLLNGLYLTQGKQHADHQTLIDHQAPNCSSLELYKGILKDQSTGVFNGKIFVQPGAQKSSARQTNKNLLLSDEAIANSKPLLEIFANDVQCTHGSTTGQLDLNQLFYLQSRGLSREEARTFLTYAFAGDVIQKIRIPILKSAIQKRLGMEELA